jgi:ribosomal protection tetracycline resistance protein
MRTLNLGILAHVDAGKTSLTERLLYDAGVIDEIGSVDDGSTQTDSLALERQRGITIKSAVVSFVVGDVTVNLIDTPGHPDFIAEVERVLSVLDGAVLVVSAVEGVQAQTRVLMRALQRLRIPTIVFVNKIDRAGARHASLLEAISERLAPAIVAMGSTAGLGSREATFTAFTETDDGFVTALTESLADHDDAFLATYLDDGASVGSHARLRRVLAAQTALGLVHPVYFGSAITGAGVAALTRGITELLPVSRPDADAPVSATVFKVERGPAGEKIAYVRMFAGTLRTRDRLPLTRGTEGRITGIAVFLAGSVERRSSVTAGHIGKLWGLSQVQIGDVLGAPPDRIVAGHQFAPPTLETVVVPAATSERGRMRAALGQLAEQDPLIDVRQDDARQEVSVSLYGEVQKEVIQATLAGEFGVDVTFEETTTICVERPAGTGSAVEFIGVAPNPFLATIGLRVDPAPIDSGVEFRLEVELGSMPSSFFSALHDAITQTLREGPCGWQVTDCVVTMTHSGYWARQSHAHGTFDASMSSTAGDFRNLTPLVLMDALVRAGTEVREPLHHFRLEIPVDALGVVLPALGRLRAVPQSTTLTGSVYLLEGELPAARIYELQQQIPTLTRGEGVLECVFERYEKVHGEVPTRPRTDQNPLNRKEYLLHVQRRV